MLFTQEDEKSLLISTVKLNCKVDHVNSKSFEKFFMLELKSSILRPWDQILKYRFRCPKVDQTKLQNSEATSWSTYFSWVMMMIPLASYYLDIFYTLLFCWVLSQRESTVKSEI